MDFNRLCLWCMHETLENGVCGHCGMRPGWTQDPPYALPAGTILHGRYLVGRVLGHGGFGITYLAEDLQVERTVAVKEYLPNGLCARQAGSTRVESSEEEDFQYGLKSFLEEAQTIYQLQHIPGIISVEKLYEENGTAYYTMEFLDGGDLRHRLDSAGGKLPWQEVLGLLHPVFTALEQVHRMGVTHRDISPDNIFLCRDGSVKLLDFGAARSMLQERSQSVDVILKRGYAPEEQYYTRGRQGPWTDVYALGCTVYHCMTGQVPPEATERAHKDECRPAAELCPGLPEQVNQALKKAMAVEASLRFPNVAEFRCALYGEPAGGPQPAGGNPSQAVSQGGGPPYSQPSPYPNPVPGPVPQTTPRPGLLSRFFAWLKRLFGGGRSKAQEAYVPDGASPFRAVYVPGRTSPSVPAHVPDWTSPAHVPDGASPSGASHAPGGVPLSEAAFLRGTAGCWLGQVIPVQGTLVLGRNAEACQVLFPPDAPGVSRIHCQASWQPGSQGIFLQDLGSAWGTWLANGTCLKESGAFLGNGDSFSIGEGNQFVVEIRKEAVL